MIPFIYKKQYETSLLRNKGVLFAPILPFYCPYLNDNALLRINPADEHKCPYRSANAPLCVRPLKCPALYARVNAPRYADTPKCPSMCRRTQMPLYAPRCPYMCANAPMCACTGAHTRRAAALWVATNPACL